MQVRFQLKMTNRILRERELEKSDLRVGVDPVAGDVDGHGDLEEKHVLGVEVTQRDQQAHCPAAIRQLIQHCPKLGACLPINREIEWQENKQKGGGFV